MKWINAFCLICIFLCVSYFPEAKAQENDNLRMQHARELFGQQKFFEAAIAFERAWYYSADSRIRMEANLGRAQALKQTGEFVKARNDLQRSGHLRQHPDLHQEVLYEMAFCDYMAGNYASCLGILQQLSHFYPQKAQDKETLLLFSLAALMNEDWELSRDKSLEILTGLKLPAHQTDSLINLTMDVFCECAVPLPRSEKAAANWSTFLPGSGQFYAGHPGKGVVNAGSQLFSLGLAGFMAWNNLYVSGFVMGLGMFQSFYFGGVKQAVYLTQQRNLSEMAAYKERLQYFIFRLANTKDFTAHESR